MVILLDIIVPVFGIVALAYLAARLGAFPESATRGLSYFVFNFAIPPMLFRAMATSELPSPIEWGFLISYFGGGYGAWIVAMAVSAGLFRRGLAAAAIAGMTAAFSNTVLLGIPLVLTVLGEAAALPLFLLIAFHSALFMTTVTLLVESARGRRGRPAKLAWNIARSLVTNPILMAMALGIIWNLLSWSLPGPLDSVIAKLGQAALPCALFALGASLAGYHVTGALPEALSGVALKLVLHPLIVWLLATYVFELQPLWRDVAVIIAALPVGVNVYLFAQRYETGAPAAAAAMLISTLLSVASLAGVLHLLGAG